MRGWSGGSRARKREALSGFLESFAALGNSVNKEIMTLSAISKIEFIYKLRRKFQIDFSDNVESW